MDREQVGQLQHVIDALAQDLYHPLGEIRFSGFKAEKEYSLAEAEAHDRAPLTEGTVWGQPWEYAWMFAEITLPESAAGERIVMDLNPGGESTLFLDGKPFGTRRAERMRQPHHFIVDQTISRTAVAGETHHLALEAYGGTPLPDYPGRPLQPEQGVVWMNDQPAVLGRSTFGLWNEEAYQLWLDLTMLQDLDGVLDDNDAMKEQITVHIGRLLDALDLEVPLKERRAACVEARKLLAPVMNAHNGTFAPTIGIVGNSHLDYAWLWPIRETRRKTARTFAAQLRLMKEYPEALFLASQCAEYELCRTYYPELFEEVRAAIREGHWIAEGGMWVEPDTNLTGGESLVRQFLYGKRYFREVLGVESDVAWLPDTFGYSAALPQIIRGFGMKGLTTQKIFWSYNDSERFPHHSFAWKGLDGSAIPVYLHMFYETMIDAKTVNTRWRARLDHDGTSDFYMPFGYGDGGGGPTRDDMEEIRRQQDLQGTPKLYWMHPGDYLDKRNKPDMPVYRGELYFTCHRGTYTTQAAVKKGNRLCETAMRTWEMLAAWSAFTGKSVYPKDEIERVWKELLENQFHDILPGSSIGVVYKEAAEAHSRILAAANAGIQQAIASMRQAAADCVTLVNPASHGGSRLVKLPAAYAAGAVDRNGRAYAAEQTADGALVQVEVPALGAVTLRPAKAAPVHTAAAQRCGEGFRLVNDRLEAVLNAEGELLSVKLNGRERIASVSNRFRLYRDLPRKYDAWDIDSQTENREIPIEKTCEAEILCAEGLRASIRVRTAFGSSVAEQVISLDAGADMLVFENTVDWHECHRLLKVSFDTGIPANEAAHQIQFGYLERPAHRSRRYDADRFEVCNHAWSAMRDATHGAALLNDCKYGISACDGVLSLSLLRAPTYPDAEADRGLHTFTYAYRVWDGTMEDAVLNASAEALNIPLVTVDGELPLPSMLAIDDPAIVLESLKLAEDGSGDLVVRLYESQNGARTATVSLAAAVSSAALCNMMEEPQEPAVCADNVLKLDFRPFEIKTVRFTC